MSELTRDLLQQAAPTVPAESATFDRLWRRARRQRRLTQVGTGLVSIAVLAVGLVWSQQLLVPSPTMPDIAAQPPTDDGPAAGWQQVTSDPILGLEVGSSWQVTVSPGHGGAWCIGVHDEGGNPPEVGDACDELAEPAQGEMFGPTGSDADLAATGVWWGTTDERASEVWVAFDDGTLMQSASTSDPALEFGVYAFHTEGRTPVRVEARQDGEPVGSRAVGEAAEPGGHIAIFCERFDELDRGPRMAADERADRLGALLDLAPPAVARPLDLVRDFHAGRDPETDPTYDEMPSEVQQAIGRVDDYVTAVCGR